MKICNRGLSRIGLRVDGRLFQLLVSDDGKGLPVDFAPDKSRSLGMTIISSLARQLNADVSFVDNKPGGQCLISFARG